MIKSNRSRKLKRTRLIKKIINQVIISDRSRKLKRTRLIKKIINQVIISEQENIHKIKVKLIDYNDFSKGYSFARHNDNLTHTIGIDLINNRNVARKGYSNAYYQGRAERLAFVLHNRKLALRFVIYHELAHCIFFEKGGNTEYKADTFAIERLTKEGFLKSNIPRPDWSCD